MEHVGIDLGSSQSAVCILTPNGTIAGEWTLRTHELQRFFQEQAPSVIVMESCAESRAVALLARKHKHEVRVVPTSTVRALNVGARGIKTDKRDARNLAEASFRLGDKLPTVHVRGDELAAIQDLINCRASLIHARTASINFTRSMLRKALLPKPRCVPDRFCKRIRALLKPQDDPHGVIAAQLAVLETINCQIASLDERIALLAQENDKAKRLQKIPGVGPIVALAFLVAIDDPNRFASASHVASYVGLSPGENTTGGRVRRTGVIAAGQKQLRGLLVQAAHSKMNCRRNLDPLLFWARGLELTKNRKIVVCALARRLAVVMWAMLRDDAPYDPSKTRARAPRPPRDELIADELANLIRAEVSATT
jgi:transposase